MGFVRSSTIAKVLRSSLAFAVLASVLLVVGVARAGIVFGNLGANNELTVDDTTISQAIGGSGTATNIVLAQGFTTGSSVGLNTIESVIVGLGFPSSSGNNPLVRLYTNSSGSPGTILAGGTLTGSTLTTGSVGKYTFTPASPIVLSASTSYFVVVSTTSAANTFNWYATSSGSAPAGLNSSGYTYLGTQRSLNGGSTWAAGTTVNTFASIEVVPEPANMLFVVGGVGASVGAWRLRRNRRRGRTATA